MTLISEIKSNYNGFLQDWQGELSTRLSSLNTAHFENSYMRLTSLQAWRSNIIEPYLSDGCVGFFVEAQNDALISHIQASMGSWRVALKAQRSLIENILLCLYYKDHPVEFVLWEQGKFRIPFSEALPYFKKHPAISILPDGITGLGVIDQEYGKLSKAVHSSSIDFRMTEDGKALSLWKADKKYENIWESHEKKTLQGINLLLISFFKEYLQGTNLGGLRETLGFVIPPEKDAEIKKSLGVKIKRS
jgi:hypothetical protein